MMSPDELLMGAMPYVPQSPVNSLNITQGTAGTAPGTLSGGVSMSAGVTGTAILIAWFIILFVLVACNVFTLRVQR